MELHRLHKDELLHEVGIRGFVPPDPKTASVEELRNKYRELKEKEESGEVLEDVLQIIKDKEHKFLELKLTEVSLGIASLSDPRDTDAKPERTRTLLSHCNRRLVRLLKFCQSEEEIDVGYTEKVHGLCQVLQAHIKEFRALGSERIYQATSFDAKSRREDDSGSEGDSEKSSGEDKGKGKGKGKGGSKGKGDRDHKGSVVAFHKWGLKFSGEDKTSVNSFLTDVEDKAATYGVSLNFLLRGVAEFLEGTAKTWYRMNKGDISSWNEFKILIRKEFLPLDYYDNLGEEIRNRKQGAEELIGPFVSNMLGLFSRLDKVVPEEEVLNQIIKNLHPYYTERLALTTVRSLRELKDLGKKLEVSRYRVEKYEGSPRSKPKALEPEFACKTSARKPSVSEVKVETPPKPQPSGKTPFKCWNCLKEGHRFTDCKEPRSKKFCHACGRKDVTIITCPSKCKGKRLNKEKQEGKGEGGAGLEGGR